MIELARFSTKFSKPNIIFCIKYIATELINWAVCPSLW